MNINPIALERAFGPSVRRAEKIASRETQKAAEEFARALYRAAGSTEYRPAARPQAAPGLEKLAEIMATRSQPVINVTPTPVQVVMDKEGIDKVAKEMSEVRKEDIEAIIEGVVRSIRATERPPEPAPAPPPEIHLHIDKEAFTTNVAPPNLTIEAGAIQAPTTIAEGAVRVNMPKSKGKQIEYDRQGRIIGTKERDDDK